MNIKQDKTKTNKTKQKKTKQNKTNSQSNKVFVLPLNPPKQKVQQAIPKKAKQAENWNILLLIEMISRVMKWEIRHFLRMDRF